MLIAFEGMDGVGKSTVSASVAQRLGIRHETQKLVSMLDIKQETFEQFVKSIRKAENKKITLLFFTFRCMLDKEGKEDLIVERSMLSTYFYEHNKVSEEEFRFLLSVGSLPDLLFILYASVDERRKRIFGRNNMDEDLKSTEAMSDGYKEMLDCAHKFNIPYIGINTEKYSFEEITDICSQIIEKYKNMSDIEKPGFIEEMNNEFGFDSLYKERMLTLNE